jgi:hypothetical protein
MRQITYMRLGEYIEQQLAAPLAAGGEKLCILGQLGHAVKTVRQAIQQLAVESVARPSQAVVAP